MSGGGTDRSAPSSAETDAGDSRPVASDGADAGAAARGDGQAAAVGAPVGDPPAAHDGAGRASVDDARSASRAARTGEGPSALDGVSGFMGMRWEDPQTVRLQIRPDLINAGGLLSGVVTYALVDYCMGSALWAQTTSEERIATISISINYIQTATDGEIVCRTLLDRRNRTTAVLRSEVRHEDDRLLVTAIGSYTIFPRRRAPRPG
ncbi:MAG TPA: PaaI family thioesterase [Solirubrobacteraceae bacterium]|nr:PaaI family thioesterase [Solirubrobacteraceae bacterium]